MEEEKKIQNVDEKSLEDSKKIELYVNNRDNGEAEDGISIMNIFGYMKKRFFIYAFIMVIGLLVGVLVPYVMVMAEPSRDAAIAVVGFNQGEKIDINEIKSSYVVTNALENANISKKLDVSVVQSNITITGILTEETQQRKEIIDAVVEKDPTRLATLEFTLEYEDSYLVTLNNEFKVDKKTITLSTSDTENLLSSLIASYSDYYVEKYLDDALPDNVIESLNLTTLDYLDTLDNCVSELKSLRAYCVAKANIVKSFRASDGMSFTDLVDMIDYLQETTIGYANSYIYLNGITKDASQAKTMYQYNLREAKLDLEQVKANITTLQNSIDTYKQDEIVINNDNGSSQTVKVNSDAYNALVNELTQMNEKKTTIEKNISVLEDKLAKLNTSPTSEQLAKAQSFVTEALNRTNEMYDIVSNNVDELHKSSAYKSAYINAIQTTNDVKTSYKNVLIGAGVGVVVGLLAWVVDAFILEMRASNKKAQEREER